MERDFKNIFERAYDKVSVDDMTRNELKKNILQYNHKTKKINWLGKWSTVAAVLLFFVGVNIILFNMNTGSNAEVTTTPVESSEYYIEEKIIHSMSVVSAKNTYNVDVVCVNEVNFDSENQTITGDFILRTSNKSGTLIDWVPLVSGAVGENGLSLSIDEESLRTYFSNYSYIETIEFKYPINSEKTRFLTTLFGVKSDGTFVEMSFEENMPDVINVGSLRDFITSNNFRTVANENGYYYDYISDGENGAFLIIYKADITTGIIRAEKMYQGKCSGDDYDAALRGTMIMYELITGFSVPLESDVAILSGTGLLSDKTQVNVEYKQVSTSIATDKDSLISYITDAFTNVEIIGFSDETELENYLFEETAYGEMGVPEDTTMFKMIGDKLGFFYTYSGVPIRCSDMAVSVPYDEKITDVYILSNDLSEHLIVKVRVLLGDDGKWRVDQVQVDNVV